MMAVLLILFPVSPPFKENNNGRGSRRIRGKNKGVGAS